VSLPVIALATVLGSEAAMAVPAGLATSISACALTSVANGTGAGWAIFKIVTMTKIKIGLIGVIAVAGLVVPLVFQHQGQVQLQEEVKALRQRTAELEAENDLLLKNARQGRSMGVSRAPVFMENTAASLEKRTSEFAQTNVYTRLMTKSPKITAEQAETFLKENNRNASSLLAAFRTTQDPALLQEAMQKFPNDPMVAFEAAFRENSNPGESRQWLEVLKRTAPENALGNYLSALDYFKSGHGDLAVQELLAASGKKQFEDYTQARVQDDEEAYLSAGYSVAEAKTVSSMQLMLPQLQQIKQLGTEMLNMANAYKQSGDDRSAQTTLQMLANLGQRYANLAPGEAEVSQRWGLRWKRWRLIKWSRLPFTERMENRYRTASTSWGSKGKRYESST
ncbi:MAG: hypothetical protein JWN25_2778, partial [Verrucomicrobiales bacterium]|nr:hypothetical protein [Verrucomicrobiales bacterium]